MFEKLIGRDESITMKNLMMVVGMTTTFRYGTKWDVDKKGFEFSDETGGFWSDDTPGVHQ